LRYVLASGTNDLSGNAKASGANDGPRPRSDNFRRRTSCSPSLVCFSHFESAQFTPYFVRHSVACFVPISPTLLFGGRTRVTRRQCKMVAVGESLVVARCFPDRSKQTSWTLPTGFTGDVRRQPSAKHRRTECGRRRRSQSGGAWRWRLPTPAASTASPGLRVPGMLERTSRAAFGRRARPRT